MATATWRGAIEFSGFPIHVALFTTTKSRSGESFKMLAPNGQPVHQAYLDSDDKPVAKENIGRGIEIAKDEYQPLSADAIDRIQSGQKSTVLTAAGFAPLASIPFHLSSNNYYVVPDSKVAGSDKSANVIWNGLKAHGLAYVTQATLRGGSRDVILAIYATDQGLNAVAIPFIHELNDRPPADFTVDKKAAKLVGAAVGDQVGNFDAAELKSEYADRRQAVIDAVLNGDEVVSPVSPTLQEEVNDLMAVLEASSQVPA
jgi:non-homologous end joining protein Ku